VVVVVMLALLVVALVVLEQVPLSALEQILVTQ
jgi:hypothetical protein